MTSGEIRGIPASSRCDFPLPCRQFPLPSPHVVASCISFGGCVGQLQGQLPHAHSPGPLPILRSQMTIDQRQKTNRSAVPWPTQWSIPPCRYDRSKRSPVPHSGRTSTGNACTAPFRIRLSRSGLPRRNRRRCRPTRRTIHRATPPPCPTPPRRWCSPQ